MKIRKYISITAATGIFALVAAACSMQYDPEGTYSDVTEGVTEEQEEVVFKDHAAVESYMTKMYKLITDRQEHWYLDQLLIAECHSDNA